MKKKLIIMAALLCVSFVLFGAGQKDAAVKDTKAHIAVLVKGTHSDFWQYVLVGANNYGVEHADKVRVTTHGPEDDTDIEAQLAILEDVISSRPDGIVIASTSSDAPVMAIERATSLGIPVVIIDTSVNTNKVATFLATDNYRAGGLVAEQLIASLKEKNRPIEGCSVHTTELLP